VGSHASSSGLRRRWRAVQGHEVAQVAEVCACVGGAIDAVGRPRWRPIAWAISGRERPRRRPRARPSRRGGLDGQAARRAASERCTAGQRLVPSPTYPATPCWRRCRRGWPRTVVAVAMDRWGKRSTDERTPMPSGQSEQGGGRPAPGGVGPDFGTGHEPVVLGSHPTGCQPEDARGEHEGRSESARLRPWPPRPDVGARRGGEVAGERHSC